LTICADVIENGTYSDLQMYLSEPMVALAGSVRSSFQAHPGFELRVCDLKAIESAVIAWLSGCERMLDVFRNGRDPYRDFGVELYKKRYDDITGAERTICKPAVLGCAYQLGGGRMKEGKRTGLWGYAENMGVNITEAEATQHVRLFRETYAEIPLFWDHLDHAARSALAGRPATVKGKLRFEMDGPYLTVRLPSGRKMYYYRPRIVTKEFEGKDGTIFTREVLSYMGKNQFTHQWGRVYSSPGKQAENVTQATAREILAIGIRRAHEEGFNIVGSVHDEIICHQRKGDNYYTVDRLRDCMIAEIAWATGLPMDASGYSHTVYRKD
jgi:DNA polymerase